MDEEKTIIIPKLMLDDQGLNKSHASLIVLSGDRPGLPSAKEQYGRRA